MMTLHTDAGPDRTVIEALLTPGADCGALSCCQARLVDLGIRRILAQAGFTVSGDRARAEIRLAFPLDELQESWTEVVPGEGHPVRSAARHRIRRAPWGGPMRPSGPNEPRPGLILQPVRTTGPH